MDFATIMDLEQHGPDTWVGRGPRYPWGGLYGGQIVAQALRAAAHSVDPTYRVHSVHAYFIRRGDADEPIRFEVDRLRNGRAFTTRRVVARQAVGAILNLDASFQRPEAGPAAQTATMPAVPPADELPESSWSRIFGRRWQLDPAPGRANAWFRMAEPVGDEPILHACALAYLSDDLPTVAVVNQHPDRRPFDPDEEWGGGEDPFWSASLDHAIWFHQAIDADRWHLHDFTCHGLHSSRGLGVGHVFSADGDHLATITQEVLLRPVK